MRASERPAWAAGIVAPRPADRVLEVGCGHGVLLSLLAGSAARGEVVGIDRSARMTAAAGRRNAAAVAEGRVRLLTAPLTDADLGAAPFDVVLPHRSASSLTAHREGGHAGIRSPDPSGGGAGVT